MKVSCSYIRLKMIALSMSKGKRLPTFIAVFAVLAFGTLALTVAAFSSTSSGSNSLQQTNTMLQASGSHVATNGLRLSLSVAPSTFSGGGSLNITNGWFNTLDKVNNISSASNWALPVLESSQVLQCPGTWFELAFFKGYYNMNNITSASLLPLEGPGTPLCPNFSGVHFSFQPSSGLLTSTSSFASEQMQGTIHISQYYDQASGKFVNFPAGVYTLAGGDEWGNVVLVYFTVMASSTT
jgi:hypothetical protein